MLSGHGCYLCKTTWWLRYRQCAPVPVEGKRCSNCNRKALLRLNSVEWGLLMRDAIRPFNEPVYFHQTLLRASDGAITRIIDLPEFFASAASGAIDPNGFEEMRVHFHIPLDAEPDAPLKSTRDETLEVLAWHRDHPDACPHFEIETYTWGVLPGGLQRPVEEQIACEYQWVIAANNAP